MFLVYFLFTISFLSGASVGISSAGFILVYSLTTRMIKKLLKTTRKKKKKKHNKIAMLANSKWNSIEALIIQALLDLEISHEEI